MLPRVNCRWRVPDGHGHLPPLRSHLARYDAHVMARPARVLLLDGVRALGLELLLLLAFLAIVWWAAD